MPKYKYYHNAYILAIMLIAWSKRAACMDEVKKEVVESSVLPSLLLL